MTVSGAERQLQLKRVRNIRITVGVIFVILIARLWYLQVAMGDELLAESKRNSSRFIRTTAPRGLVLDRKGRVLASSRPQFIVTAMPDKIAGAGREPIRQKLASILGIPVEELERRLNKNGSPGASVRVAADVTLDVVAKIKERNDQLPGVEVGLEQLRNYTDGPLCAHVFGYVGEINADELKKMPNYPMGAFIGKSGIEKVYESYLKGKDGGKIVEVDAIGRLRRVIRTRDPVPGNTLVLNIDKEVQKAASEGLAHLTGAAVAIDPRTGEILALVSKPDFDPNLFVKGVRAADWRAIVNNKKHPLQNRAISNKYPPGSTFKIVTMAAGLRYNVVTPKMRTHCTGAFYLGKFRFGCWGRHGTMDPIKGMANSCDVFFYTVGRALGINRLAVVAREFQIDQISGIDLPGEKKGTVPDEKWKRENCREKTWYPGETVVCAIGQGYVQATPLRMALVAAAIANGGKVFEPHIVNRIINDKGKVIKTISPRVVSEIHLPESELAMIREGLRETVAFGTGKAADLPGYNVCGKTGTAEDPPRKHPHAWFVCFAPMENPTIAVCVFAEGGGHGGSTAAPIARKMLEAWFASSPKKN